MLVRHNRTDTIEKSCLHFSRRRPRKGRKAATERSDTSYKHNECKNEPATAPSTCVLPPSGGRVIRLWRRNHHSLGAEKPAARYTMFYRCHSAGSQRIYCSSAVLILLGALAMP